MKKGVFGCLALFLLVAVAGGYAAYRFVYLPGRAYVESFAQLKIVPELNARIANQAAFTPPAGQELSDTGVERFVRTQRAIRARLDTRFTDLEAKFRALNERHRSSKEKPSLSEVATAFKDLMGLYVEAKRAQVDALNAEGLSLAEYEWTRARVYEAAGLPMATAMQHLIDDAAAGRAPDLKAVGEGAAATVPERNRELVQPFAKELAESAPLAFFAL